MISNELRIGNIAQDQNGNLLKCVVITEGGTDWYVLDRTKFPLEDGWSVQPIVFTPEWLERAGFEFIEYDIPVWGLSYGNFDGEDYEGCLILEKDLEGKFYFVINGKKLIINYLHQLQNTVYVLINKELEFNLDNLN